MRVKVRWERTRKGQRSSTSRSGERSLSAMFLVSFSFFIDDSRAFCLCLGMRRYGYSDRKIPKNAVIISIVSDCIQHVSSDPLVSFSVAI